MEVKLLEKNHCNETSPNYNTTQQSQINKLGTEEDRNIFFI